MVLWPCTETSTVLILVESALFTVTENVVFRL